ncbi:hypothetical protein T484DRAFT_1862080 [Baffinella frigidus]|nr:hypothetical protein T484DRAFT_1862080 [Cryptophyta sp. CCMP2293]
MGSESAPGTPRDMDNLMCVPAPAPFWGSPPETRSSTAVGQAGGWPLDGAGSDAEDQDGDGVGSDDMDADFVPSAPSIADNAEDEMVSTVPTRKKRAYVKKGGPRNASNVPGMAKKPAPARIRIPKVITDPEEVAGIKERNRLSALRSRTKKNVVVTQLQSEVDDWALRFAAQANDWALCYEAQTEELRRVNEELSALKLGL